MKITRTRAVVGILVGAALTATTVGAAAYADSGNAVTIDAATQPDQAGKAMQLFPDATGKSFTATSNPAYAETGWEVASENAIDNPPGSTSEVKKEIRVTHTAGSSLSIGGSVGAETTLSALGFANAKVSVKFSAEHQWTTETTDQDKVEITAVPGKSAWVVAAHNQATFTGDYTFTADGTTYHVNNVTITEPAPAPGGDATSGVTYMAVEEDYGKVVNVTGATGGALPSGLVPISKTPKIKDLTAQLPKLHAAS